MADRSQIVEIDKKLAAKQKEGQDYMAAAWDEGKKGYFPEEKMKDATGTGPLSTSAWGERIRAIKAECEAIGREKETLQLAYQAESEFKRAADHARETGTEPNPASAGGGVRKHVKTFSEQFVEHPAFKANHTSRSRQPWGMDLPDFDLKTTIETGAGWAPQNLRTGKVVEYADLPLDLIDTMVMDTTDQAAVVYMEETTQTLSAIVEKAENAAYGEAAWALTQRTQTVENLPAFVPITDQQLEDVPQISTWLDRKMRYALLRRLNIQLISGTGITPLLLGVGSVTNLQTQALGAYPVPDAIMRGMTKVRTTGEAVPSAVWMHPTDVQNLMLLRDASGNYIWGKPSEAGPKFIWGVPIAETQAATQGTSYVGAFRDFARIVTKKGITVEVGYNSTDFTLGKKTVRANMRVALVWERGAAFCSVTGLPA